MPGWRAAIECVTFRLLDGTGAEPVDEERLIDLYAYPAYPAAANGPVVRGNAIASVDGGATTSGTSGGLGGPGDRQLFAVLRELADVIVVGAGTARAEKYGGATMSVAQRRRRRHRGQADTPPIALVTRSGDLAPDLAVLTDSEVPPLVLTCADTAPGARKRLGAAAEVVDTSGADPAQVDLSVALQRLGERGLSRVLTEGGPSLLGSFMVEGLLDEMCLTTAPLLVGGGTMRVATGTAEVVTPMRRAHLLADDDGYLDARYQRAR